jgi:hypothetical protein
MNPVILAAIIGGACTICAATIGGLIGKSAFFDRLIRKKEMPSFAGSRWESKWFENSDGNPIEHKEYFEFARQRKNRVYGIIKNDEYPDMEWDIEGDYNDRFLRLLWTPSPRAKNKFFLDYGCYFFERTGNGSFKGYAVGFDNESSKIEIYEHILKLV